MGEPGFIAGKGPGAVEAADDLFQLAAVFLCDFRCGANRDGLEIEFCTPRPPFIDAGAIPFIAVFSRPSGTVGKGAARQRIAPNRFHVSAGQ